jgi:Tol biopolymer transport system component
VILAIYQHPLSRQMAGMRWSPWPNPDSNQKLWLYDLNRGTATPFTFGEGNDYYPTWSPDSQQVAFSFTRGSQEDIYVKPVGGGSNEQLLLGGEGNKEPDRWSADGCYILFDYFSKKTESYDVWALPLFGDRKPFPVVQSPGTDYYGTFSSDGKWVAYVSDESGRSEIYVVPFPGPGGKWQVSTSGGANLYGRPARSYFITRWIRGSLPRNTTPRGRISLWVSPGSFLEGVPGPA